MSGTVAIRALPLRRLLLLVAAALVGSLCSAPAAHAASGKITVTTTVDELSEDGNCSLREALRAANRDQPFDACAGGRGADLIVLPPGIFRLSRGAPGEDENRGGDLDVLRDVTLRGAGSDRTVIVAVRDRVLDVYGPGVVVVEGVTLREGAAPEGDPAMAPEVGGCVRNTADLTLVDVRVEACKAARAAGVASLGQASRLSMVRSVVAGSAARSALGPGPAGGIGSEGELRLTDSMVMGNSGSLGAGIFSSGPATILRSTVAGNSASAAVILDPGRGLGAGIYNGGEMAIEASTVSRNRAAGGGAGVYSAGGLRVTDSTIAFNESFGPPSPELASAGLWAAGLATVRGSILAANREDGLPDDCAGVLSLGGNLVQAPCAPLDPSDRGGLDPLLGPLRPNGGSTLTHAPLEGSPALDAALLCAPADQRGLARPLGPACDIGAVEREDLRAPAAPVRDEFASADGRLSSDWAGPGRRGYRGEAGQLVPQSGGPVYWVRALLGQSQSAAVTLRAVDRAGPNIQGLLLKVRREPGRAGWSAGAIRVAADGAAGEVRVEVFAPGAAGWRLAKAFAAPLADGDVLGARAFADGTVAAYRNNALLGVADTRELTGVGELFVGRSGYAGLWFERAPGAILDDFAAQ